MSQDPRLFSPMFSIDVCTDARAAAVSNKIDANELIVNLLKQLVDGQQQELKLLSEIAHWTGLSHKQRQQEITQWKDTNPGSGPELPHRQRSLGQGTKRLHPQAH